MYACAPRASAPTVEALTADEGLLTGTLRNVAQALRNKAGRSAGDSRDGGSFADILALSIEPRVSGPVYCCDSCQSEPGGPIGVGPGSHGGASCTGCSQTGFYTTCANFRVNCGSSGCSVWSIQKVQNLVSLALAEPSRVGA